MKKRHFARTQTRSKEQWRKETSNALENLTLDQLQEVRSRFSYPLRIKDFNPRMCKALLQIMVEVENETNRNLEDS